MNCPKCNKEMEFEEAKNFYGLWYCECGFEGEGSCIPCGAEDGHITDYNEVLDEKEKS